MNLSRRDFVGSLCTVPFINISSNKVIVKKLSKWDFSSDSQSVSWSTPINISYEVTSVGDSFSDFIKLVGNDLTKMSSEINENNFSSVYYLMLDSKLLNISDGKVTNINDFRQNQIDHHAGVFKNDMGLLVVCDGKIKDQFYSSISMIDVLNKYNLSWEDYLSADTYIKSYSYA